MAANELNFRPTTPADAPLLRRWDEQPHIRESNGHDDWQWETELLCSQPWREQWIAMLGNRPIGFLEIMDPHRDEERYWGETGPGHRAIDIWIGEADELGKGHGTRMMRFAIERCFAVPEVHTILLDPMESNRRAHRFYEKLGFIFLEPRQFGDDKCRVYALERDIWERRDKAE